jgi:hypothetical protein
MVLEHCDNQQISIRGGSFSLHGRPYEPTFKNGAPKSAKFGTVPNSEVGALIRLPRRFVSFSPCAWSLAYNCNRFLEAEIAP